ncbi:LPD7 domain-containing protein [Pseudomonas asuensis]|nr:LPD7 domain-containing protein [Pseudomonas asuensis]
MTEEIEQKWEHFRQTIYERHNNPGKHESSPLGSIEDRNVAFADWSALSKSLGQSPNIPTPVLRHWIAADISDFKQLSPQDHASAATLMSSNFSTYPPYTELMSSVDDEMTKKIRALDAENTHQIHLKEARKAIDMALMNASAPALAAAEKQLGSEWEQAQKHRLNQRISDEETVKAAMLSALKDIRNELQKQEKKDRSTKPLAKRLAEMAGVEPGSKTHEISRIDRAIKEIERTTPKEIEPQKMSFSSLLEYERENDRERISRGIVIGGGSTKQQWVEDELVKRVVSPNFDLSPRPTAPEYSPHFLQEIENKLKVDARAFAEKLRDGDSLAQSSISYFASSQLRSLSRQREFASPETPQHTSSEKVNKDELQLHVSEPRANGFASPVAPAPEPQSSSRHEQPDSILSASSVPSVDQQEATPSHSTSSSPLTTAGESNQAEDVGELLPAKNQVAEEKIEEQRKLREAEIADQLTHERSNPLEANGFIFPDKPSDTASAEDPKDVIARLVEGITYKNRNDGSVLYLVNDNEAFIDHGRQILMAPKASEDEAILAAILLAKEKFGSSFNITGTDEFKRQAMEVMLKYEIDVKFSDPQQLALKNDLIKKREEQQEPESESKSESAQFNSDARLGTPAQEASVATGPSASKVIADDVALASSLLNVKQEPVDRMQGVVKEYGAAPYHNEPKAKESFFVTLENADGKYNTVWGVDLPRALHKADIQAGDTIQLENLGREKVIVPVPEYDETGNQVGTHELETYRNAWRADLLDRPAVEETLEDFESDYTGHDVAFENELIEKVRSGDIKNAIASMDEEKLERVEAVLSDMNSLGTDAPFWRRHEDQVENVFNNDIDHFANNLNKALFENIADRYTQLQESGAITLNTSSSSFDNDPSLKRSDSLIAVSAHNWWTTQKQLIEEWAKNDEEKQADLKLLGAEPPASQIYWFDKSGSPAQAPIDDYEHELARNFKSSDTGSNVLRGRDAISMNSSAAELENHFKEFVMNSNENSNKAEDLVLRGVKRNENGNGYETTVLLFKGQGDYLQGFVKIGDQKHHVIAHINERKVDTTTGELKPNFLKLSERVGDGQWKEIGFGNAVNKRNDNKQVHFDEMLFNVGGQTLNARITKHVDEEMHRKLGFVEERLERPKDSTKQMPASIPAPSQSPAHASAENAFNEVAKQAQRPRMARA